MSTTEIGTRHSMEPDRRTVQLYQQVLSVNISANAYGLTPFLRFTFPRVPQILAFESVFAATNFGHCIASWFQRFAFAREHRARLCGIFVCVMR